MLCCGLFSATTAHILQILAVIHVTLKKAVITLIYGVICSIPLEKKVVKNFWLKLRKRAFLKQLFTCN